MCVCLVCVSVCQAFCKRGSFVCVLFSGAQSAIFAACIAANGEHASCCSVNACSWRSFGSSRSRVNRCMQANVSFLRVEIPPPYHNGHAGIRSSPLRFPKCTQGNKLLLAVAYAHAMGNSQNERPPWQAIHQPRNFPTFPPPTHTTNPRHPFTHQPRQVVEPSCTFVPGMSFSAAPHHATTTTSAASAHHFQQPHPHLQHQPPGACPQHHYPQHPPAAGYGYY